MKHASRRSTSASKSRGAPRKESGIQAKVHNFKREQILDVAAELFFEHGYRATTVDAIADALSVTKPFIYCHFKNKEDILQQLFERTLAVSLTFVDGINIDNGHPSDILRELVRRFVVGAINTRHSGGIFWRGEKDLPPLDKNKAREFRRRFEAPFKAVLERGVAEGSFRISDLTLTMLCIEGMINWSYIWYRPGGERTPEQVAEHMSEMVINMITAKC